ncbi:MAG TPA: restriction endonuclease subunit S, partial [Phycisphaerae bacterium]|nr:restriction endonuclease subunit S [Phycisphaerae bacterium]
MTLVNGFAFKPSHWKGEGLPIIRIQNLNDTQAEFNHCPDRIANKYHVRDGDLLFAWSGTPGTSFGAHIWNRGPALLNQHIFRIEFNDAEIDKRFLRYAINQNLAEYIAAAHGAAGLAHITKGKFEASELLIPPGDEQRRIVEKIEELLTDLDAGVAALGRVRKNLKRYRSSVLKAAVEGRLTAAWRAEHPDVEPAEVLLERILVERRKRWIADQLDAWKARKQKAGWDEAKIADKLPAERKKVEAKYQPPAAP